MNNLVINHLEFNDLNADHIRIKLANTPWLVACLCAAWCDTCEVYKKAFLGLSKLHTDKCFAWIDIEDQSHLVDEIDIENFPTILIQYNDKILFLGTVLPDTQQIHRMLQSLQALDTSIAIESLNKLDRSDEKLNINININAKSNTKDNEPKSLLSKEQVLPHNWSLRQQLLNSI